MISLSGLEKSPGFTVATYRVAGGSGHHAAVRAVELPGAGFGGGATTEEAQTKAIYEWIERWVFRQQRSPAELSSSGWAAHRSIEEARSNALAELIERDAILTSWLTKTAPRISGLENFYPFERRFPLLEFGQGDGFVVLGVILERSQGGRILISACAPNAKIALEKLTVDAERAFSLLVEKTPFQDSQIAAHHQAFCEAESAALAWIFEGGPGIAYGPFPVSYQDYAVRLWNGSTAHVSRAHAPSLQELYFGEPSLARLNRGRLRPLKNRNRLNPMPHPIL